MPIAHRPLVKCIVFLLLPLLSLTGHAAPKTISLSQAVTLSTHSAQATGQATLARPEVQSFIQHMVDKYHFSAEKLRHTFAKVHLRPRIINTIHNPKEATPWYQYKKIFLTPDRIAAGVSFWHQHHDKLAEAEKKYGVPANIILGVLGVETFYGTRTGTHSALDALATLAFNYPERSKFFTSELEALFLLSREQHFDPLALKSSYAGALGYPQFMPSSYRDYAIDFSQDGIADLINNPDDAIGSIANYLAKKGSWHASQPVIIPAKIKLGQTLPPKAHKKVKTIAELAKEGITPQQSISQNTKAIAFQIKEQASTETFLGLQNFKAILRYNPRINYAMAVVSLANAIQDAQTNTTASKAWTKHTTPHFDGPVLAKTNTSAITNKSKHNPPHFDGPILAKANTMGAMKLHG